MVSQEQLNSVLGALPQIYEFNSKQEHFDFADKYLDKVIQFLNEKGLEINAENIINNKEELNNYLMDDSIVVAETENENGEEETMIEKVKNNKQKYFTILVFIIVIYFLFIK
jgi:hypothetical protein